MICLCGQSNTSVWYQTTFRRYFEFSVPQIEYPLEGSSKKGSHVYFLLIVAMVLQLWCQIVTSGHHSNIRTTFTSNNSTIWQNNSITQKTCNRKYTWLHILLPLVVFYLKYWELQCNFMFSKYANGRESVTRSIRSLLACAFSHTYHGYIHWYWHNVDDITAMEAVSHSFQMQLLCNGYINKIFSNLTTTFHN